MFTLLAKAVACHIAILGDGCAHALYVVLSTARRNEVRNSTRIVVDDILFLNGIPQGPPGSFKSGRRLRNGALNGSETTVEDFFIESTQIFSFSNHSISILLRGQAVTLAEVCQESRHPGMP